MPRLTFFLLVILITTLCFHPISAALFNVEVSGQELGLQDVENPYLKVSLELTLTTPGSFIPIIAFPPTVDHTKHYRNWACRVLDQDGEGIVGCEGITAGNIHTFPSSGPRKMTTLLITLETPFRLAFSIELLDPIDKNPMVTYKFPGISPVTLNTDPNLNIYPVPSASDFDWTPRATNWIQEYPPYLTPSDPASLYICTDTLICCKLGDTCDNNWFNALRQLSGGQGYGDFIILSSPSSSLGSILQYPTIRISLPSPGDQTSFATSAWPFVLGQSYYPDVSSPTVPAGESYLKKVTPERSRVEVGWALVPNWYSSLPTQPTELRFHLPDYPIYKLYSNLIECFCWDAVFTTCKPNDLISITTSLIKCTFSVSFLAQSNPAVILYPDIAEDSDVFPITLTYLVSPTGSQRAIVSKSPITTPNYLSILRSLAISVSLTRSLVSQFMGTIEYPENSGKWYSATLYDVKMSGISTSHHYHLAPIKGDTSNDLISCSPQGPGLWDTPATNGYIGHVAKGKTTWEFNPCIYYRALSNDVHLYPPVADQTTYTTPQPIFRWYYSSDRDGLVEGGVLKEKNGDVMSTGFSKQQFQPYPYIFPSGVIPSFSLPQWDSAFSFIANMPVPPSGSVNYDVWAGAFGSIPDGMIIRSSFTAIAEPGATITLMVKSHSPSLETDSISSQTLFSFTTNNGLATSLEMEYWFDTTSLPLADRELPLKMHISHTFISPNTLQINTPFIQEADTFFFVPNIATTNRFIQLTDNDGGVSIPMNDESAPTDSSLNESVVQSNRLIFKNTALLKLSICVLSNDDIMNDGTTIKGTLSAIWTDGVSANISINHSFADLCDGKINVPVQNVVPAEAIAYFKITFRNSPSIYHSPPFKTTQGALPYAVEQLQTQPTHHVPYQRPNDSEIKIITLGTSPVNSIKVSYSMQHTPILDISGGKRGLMVIIKIPYWVGIADPLTDPSSCVVKSSFGGMTQFETTVKMEKTGEAEPAANLVNRDIVFLNVDDPDASPFPLTAMYSATYHVSCTFNIIHDVSAARPKDVNEPIQFGGAAVEIGSGKNSILTSGASGPGDFYFLHPFNAIFCDNCTPTDLPVDTVKETPPPLKPQLPTTIRSLTGHCDIVVTNKVKEEWYKPKQHENMCSIPIAGMLTTRVLQHGDVDPNVVIETTKPEYNLCDCRCKGYWIDDVDNNDYKKCSKCAVPNCPALFTPNSECTACECSTPQCKRFTTNVFGMIYFKPQVLRYLIDITSDTTKLYIPASLSDIDISNYIHNPTQSYKTTYFNLITKFSHYLKEYLTTAQNSSPTPSILQSVLITPLVEGSFTAWKITLNFVNGSKQPLSKMAPLYGLPAVEQKMSELFGAFIIQQFSLTQYPIDFSTHVLTSPFSSSSPSTTLQTKLPLFTSDVIKVGCINRDDHDNGVVITRDMLHDCPLPNQYVSAKNNVTKADTLNPLWSKCDTNDSISFINYESLLDTTTKSTSLRVRQLYPHCFDFAGVNVGKEYHIPCGYNPTTDLLYSTTSSSLILPSYTTALLSSFVPSPTTSDEAKKRLTRLLSLQQSRFPSFPSPTIVLCPVPDPTLPPMPQTLPTSPTQRCSVDTYGDQCQYKSIISETSMTSSPTTVSPQAYAHVQWDFMGDNTQELTIVLYSTQKKNDGQGYFVWSQLLTTVPVASLYASAQVPTLDQSKLFEMVYDAIANGNNIDLVNIYSSSTKIAIKGYFTRGAQQLINLDEKQIVEQFKFDLPMVCTEFNVRCSHGSSQYCTQNDGRCKCKPGYYDVNPTQERLPNYTIDSRDTTTNIDGSDLTCLPLCQNDGEWDNKTSTCKCQDGYNGEYCEVKDNCQVNKSSLCQGDNGYIAFTLLTEDSEATTPSCQDTKCQCYGHWINQSDAPNTDDLIKKKPKDYVARNNGCSICSLKPINSQFYSKEQLVIINDYYSSNTELSTQYYGNEDTMYTQTYQPTTTTLNTDEQLHPLTQQRCYITGTQPTTYDDGNCIKCQCKRGYGGDYCQLHIAYANMTYTPTDGNNYVYDKTTEVLLFNKLTEELSLSMNNFDQTQMFVIQHNRDYHWVEIGLYTGLDFFTRNAEYNASVQQQQQQQSEGYLMSTQQTTTPTGFNPTLLPTNLDSLYTQWDDLTTNFPTTPVKNQDTNDYLGPIDAPAVIQDPACFEQEIIGCSGDAPKRMNSYALLIGLVVGLVGAALLFIILLLILLWCRKNERGFWKSQKEQERDEMSSFVMAPRQDFKGSTAAPSMTIGTTSIKPISGAGIELQPTENYTKTSAIQSATNHTEIVDPSLPPNIKGYKDAKGQIFYVDSDTMTTSWDHPNEAKDKNGEGGAEDYGW